MSWKLTVGRWPQACWAEQWNTHPVKCITCVYFCMVWLRYWHIGEKGLGQTRALRTPTLIGNGVWSIYLHIDDVVGQWKIFRIIENGEGHDTCAHNDLICFKEELTDRAVTKDNSREIERFGEELQESNHWPREGDPGVGRWGPAEHRVGLVLLSHHHQRRPLLQPGQWRTINPFKWLSSHAYHRAALALIW